MVQSSLLASYIHVAAVVAAYWVISILTVFVNKTLLSSKTVDLDAPLFVTWYQCLVSTAICFIMSKLTLIMPKLIYFPEGSPLSMTVMWKMLPLSLLFTGMIAFNNLCLKFVGVAFYYIGRSLTTVFNVILTYIVLGQTTSSRAIFCCGIIVSGFWLGVDQENVAGSLSIIGTFYGIMGSLALSMYSIYTKQLLPFVRQEIWLLSYYNNFYSSIIFIPLIILNGEIPELMKYEQFGNPKFWLLLSIGGLCGFAIGYVTSLQIKVTSPLTHNISGTAKACAQTVLATYWYDETKPLLWWVSNYVVLGGSGAYARVKQQEMEKQHSTALLSKDKEQEDV